MSRHPRFDLGYLHEAATSVPHALQDPTSPRPRELDLTARLRCLKALYDLERDACLEKDGVCPQAH